MSVAGDTFPSPARILAIIWEGATASGDTVQLVSANSPDLLWPGRTDTTQTYQGANFGPEGLHAPLGFKLSQISSGRVLVFLREN